MPSVVKVSVLPRGRGAYSVTIRNADDMRGRFDDMVGIVYKRRMPKNFRHRFLWGWDTSDEKSFGFPLRRQPTEA